MAEAAHGAAFYPRAHATAAGYHASAPGHLGETKLCCDLITLALAAGRVRAPAAADAATLRWADRGDPQTTDPHSQNEGLTNNVNILVYEALIGRDKKLELEP